jgi:DNA-binding XRE family transcriptional regulator
MRTKIKKSFNKEIFGERIKTLREKSGMIQADAAKEIGRTRSSYVIIEGGKVSPSADCIVDILTMFRKKKLDVSLDYLFGLTDHLNEGGATLEYKNKYEALLKEYDHIKEVSLLQKKLLEAKKA